VLVKCCPIALLKFWDRLVKRGQVALLLRLPDARPPPVGFYHVVAMPGAVLDPALPPATGKRYRDERRTKIVRPNRLPHLASLEELVANDPHAPQIAPSLVRQVFDVQGAPVFGEDVIVAFGLRAEVTFPKPQRR
jgi:hypothetical protein